MKVHWEDKYHKVVYDLKEGYEIISDQGGNVRKVKSIKNNKLFGPTYLFTSDGQDIYRIVPYYNGLIDGEIIENFGSDEKF